MESTLCHLHLHYRRCGPPPTAATQQVRLELLGYHVLVARSQKALPPVMCVVVSRAEAPVAVAHSEVPTDHWADDWCSCVW
jgi:hypothetical protein